MAQMTHEEFMELLDKIRQLTEIGTKNHEDLLESARQLQRLAEVVGKLNDHVRTTREALLVIRKIMDVQSQRLDNLEDFMQNMSDFMQKMNREKPNPYVGTPPSE